MKITSILGYVGAGGGLTTASMLRSNELALRDNNNSYEIKTLSVQPLYATNVQTAINKIKNLSGECKLNFSNPFIEDRERFENKLYIEWIYAHIKKYSQNDVIFEISKDGNIRYYLIIDSKKHSLVTIVNNNLGQPFIIWLFEPFLNKAVTKLELDEKGTVVIQTHRNPRTNLPISRDFLRTDGTLVFESKYLNDRKEVYIFNSKLYDNIYEIIVQLDKDKDKNQIIFFEDARISPLILDNYKKLFIVGHRADYIHWKEDIYGIPDRKWLKSEWKKIYELVVSNDKVEIIALTPMNMEFIKSIYPSIEKKVHVIGNLVPSVPLPKVTIENTTQNSNHFAFIGRVHEAEKRISLILESFKLISEKNNLAKLFFVGDFFDAATEKVFKDTVKKLGIEDQVSVTGYTNNINKTLLDLEIDTAILISRSETFSMVVPEALQLGIKYLIVDTPYWYSTWENFKGVGVARISENVKEKSKIIADKLYEISNEKLSRTEIMEDFCMKWDELNFVGKYLNLIESNIR
ncbi:glycosyltransferase [Lactococcus formosensis]|uniref:glycosyltransferase n=1 Tax=Lactococcus formosensis TaxID=1281486 RepID=UPI0022E5A556|nr:glycosyltransferase [Lactococcus formosensis]